MRFRLAIPAICLGLAAPNVALGAGGPVPPIQGGNGIVAAGSSFRYVAIGAGPSTVVQQLTRDGRVRSAVQIPGHYGIPGVDYSGSTTGLSADGDMLILAELPGPRTPRTTRLAVLGAPHLTVLGRVVLHGWFTVDAISPTGHWLYLIHYPSANISNYEVRAYDLSKHRLLAAPIVDPHDRGEAMTGFALGRATSSDGRWDYTLYTRPSGVPFIHALDTVAVRAVCIDLPSLARADLSSAALNLGPGGSVLRIEDNGITQAMVDTATYAVTPVAKPMAADPIQSTAAHGDQSTGGGGDNVPWAVLVLLLVAGGAFAIAALGARRRARTRIT
jgi:hypothetical protein